jgi:hypothetical protein
MKLVLTGFRATSKLSYVVEYYIVEQTEPEDAS